MSLVCRTKSEENTNSQKTNILFMLDSPVGCWVRKIITYHYRKFPGSFSFFFFSFSGPFHLFDFVFVFLF